MKQTDRLNFVDWKRFSTLLFGVRRAGAQGVVTAGAAMNPDRYTSDHALATVRFTVAAAAGFIGSAVLLSRIPHLPPDLSEELSWIGAAVLTVAAGMAVSGDCFRIPLAVLLLSMELFIASAVSIREAVGGASGVHSPPVFAVAMAGVGAGWLVLAAGTVVAARGRASMALCLGAAALTLSLVLPAWGRRVEREQQTHLKSVVLPAFERVIGNDAFTFTGPIQWESALWTWTSATAAARVHGCSTRIYYVFRGDALALRDVHRGAQEHLGMYASSLLLPQPRPVRPGETLPAGWFVSSGLRPELARRLRKQESSRYYARYHAVYHGIDYIVFLRRYPQRPDKQFVQVICSGQYDSADR